MLEPVDQSNREGFGPMERMNEDSLKECREWMLISPEGSVALKRDRLELGCLSRRVFVFRSVKDEEEL